ncbi:hypothetical protein RJ639_041570 [Escallonia herrerae]|uniref:non-specific serine/threonine protein kinase n=1 Tax=Escallonia herrerae TaxID=1293975 RepID=A0AA88WFW9_9ASTE|nr:hypothetical protein RJ639_041570 [Escallonia herrerae]
MAGKDTSVGASGVAEENVVMERGRDLLPPTGGKKGSHSQTKSRDSIASLDGRACVVEEAMGDVKDCLGMVAQNLQTLEDHVLEELKSLKKAVTTQDELHTRFMELFANLQEQIDVVKGGAVVTPSPRVDAPKPKEFGGKRDAKELGNFIWHMECYFEGANITNEKAKGNNRSTPLALTGDYKGRSPLAAQVTKSWNQQTYMARSYLDKAARKMKKWADKRRLPMEYNLGDKRNCFMLEKQDMLKRWYDHEYLKVMLSPLNPELYSFHINCGGKGVNGDEKPRFTYEDDTNSGGPSNFFQSATNWGFSSTGHFLDSNNRKDTYIESSTSVLRGNNPDLYKDARLSPLSLTYYGYCLRDGNYTVHLHFAEIMFTDDKTYGSLGRHVFDIYIQRKRVWKDFNIEDEAGGVGKGVVRRFKALVTNGTLEIRLYWAGKGTIAIPVRGVYGPLISAISVVSDRKPPSENGNNISAGTVVGIVVGIAFAIFLLGVLWWKGCLPRIDTMELGTWTTLGLLLDGTTVAVKQLSSKSKQGNREFVNEIGMISALQHPHLVKLYGCCIEGNQLLLVYEYMENNSLARALFGKVQPYDVLDAFGLIKIDYSNFYHLVFEGPEELRLNLDWATRQKICIGIARGLTYLHEESRLKIVHRDIKATNVLLDRDLNPKISDFGLAKLDEEESTHISTRIAGTYGYMAPEYVMRGYLTDKADVYSFGIVALEIVSGRSNTTHQKKDDGFFLLDQALVLKSNGKLMELVDPRLESQYNEEEVMTMINVALLCTNVSSAVRPSMSSVVSMLEGKAVVQEFVLDVSGSSDMMKAQEIQMYQHQHCQGSSTGDSQIQSTPIEGPWAASDLYSINLDSQYWENRDTTTLLS